MNITDNEITGSQNDLGDRPVGIEPVSNAEGSPVKNENSGDGGDNTNEAGEEESKPYTGGILDDDSDHVGNEDDLREIRVNDDLGEPNAEDAESHVSENGAHSGDITPSA